MGLFRKKNKPEEIQTASQDLDAMVFHNKVLLRDLEKKSTRMYETELNTARKLKEQGLKSNSNYMKIGILYQIIQTIHQSYDRMDEITSTTELNAMMGDLASILGSVNSMGKGISLSNAKGVFSGMKEMQSGAAKDQNKLAKAYSGLDKAAGSGAKVKDTEPIFDPSFIDQLISGKNPQQEIQIPEDAVPIETEKVPVKTPNAEDLMKELQEIPDQEEPVEMTFKERIQALNEALNSL